MTANLTAFPVISNINIITFYYIYYSVLFSMVPCDSYTTTLQSEGRIFRARAVKFKPQ